MATEPNTNSPSTPTPIELHQELNSLRKLKASLDDYWAKCPQIGHGIEPSTGLLHHDRRLVPMVRYYRTDPTTGERTFLLQREPTQPGYHWECKLLPDSPPAKPPAKPLHNPNNPLTVEQEVDRLVNIAYACLEYGEHETQIRGFSLRELISSLGDLQRHFAKELAHALSTGNP